MGLEFSYLSLGHEPYGLNLISAGLTTGMGS